MDFQVKSPTCENVTKKSDCSPLLGSWHVISLGGKETRADFWLTKTRSLELLRQEAERRLKVKPEVPAANVWSKSHINPEIKPVPRAGKRGWLYQRYSVKLKNLPVYPFTFDRIYPGLFATHPEPRTTEGRSLEGSGGPLGALTQERAGGFLKDEAEAPIRKAPILSHTCFPPLPDQGHCCRDPALRASPGRQPLSLLLWSHNTELPEWNRNKQNVYLWGRPRTTASLGRGSLRKPTRPPSWDSKAQSALREHCHSCQYRLSHDGPSGCQLTRVDGGVCEWSDDGEGRLQEWTRPGCQTPKACPTPFSAVTPVMPTWSPGLLPNATSHTALSLPYGFLLHWALLQADSLQPLLDLQLSL